MVLKKNNFSFGIGVLVLLCIGFFAPAQVSGALVWSEYFDELDFDTWTMQSCQLIDNELHGVNGDHVPAVIAYRESTVSVGTWKFDLREVGEWGEELDICKIWFMSPLEPEVPDWEYYALSIVHSSSTEGVRLVYRIEKYVDSLPKVLLSTHLGESVESTKGTLHHFAITRTSSGLMRVYLNGTQILQATDTAITSTSWFGFYTWDDWAFDNVEVYDSIEIGQSYSLVLVGIISIGIATVALIIIFKRRPR